MARKRTARRASRLRSLLVVVGPETPSRFRLAQRLIERDHAVVLCDGPPGCPLVRGSDCAMAGSADAVILLPPAEDASRETAIGLSMCGRRAARTIVVEPTDLSPDVDATRVTSAEAVVLAVPGVLQGLARPRES